MQNLFIYNAIFISNQLIHQYTTNTHHFNPKQVQKHFCVFSVKLIFTIKATEMIFYLQWLAAVVLKCNLCLHLKYVFLYSL